MTEESAEAGRADGRERLLTAARAELVAHGLAGVSLRGIARRAGLSHAAPKYHFVDRAGLLTAVATSGFLELADALRETAGRLSVRSLGRTYVDFGLGHPELFDLMFRPAELRPDDPDLLAAQAAALGLLSTAVGTQPAAASAAGPPQLALVSWAFAHGLVVLARDGALRSVSAEARPDLLIEQLITTFDAAVSTASNEVPVR